MSSRLNSSKIGNAPKKQKQPPKEEKDFSEVHEQDLFNFYKTYGDKKGMSVDDLLNKIELFGLNKCEYLKLNLKSIPQNERKRKLKFEEFKELFSFDLNQDLFYQQIFNKYKSAEDDDLQFSYEALQTVNKKLGLGLSKEDTVNMFNVVDLNEQKITASQLKTLLSKPPSSPLFREVEADEYNHSFSREDFYGEQ